MDSDPLLPWSVGTYIRAYSIGSPGRCLGVAHITIAGLPANCERDQSYLFLLAKTLVAFVLDLLAITFQGPTVVSSAGHPINADGTFDTVLHDMTDFWSDTYT